MSAQAFPALVADTIRRRRLASREDRVLVALSGGADSTSLAVAMSILRSEGELAWVGALHVDHGLREGGAAEAACARETCERFGIPFAAVRVTVGKGNLQAEARRARYAALRAEATRVAATLIATGHTRTDQAETVLMRLLRGSGARGLGGIPPRRGEIIRPLLDRSRTEVEAWLSQIGVAWREDPTNSVPRYTRNRLRLEVWPALLRLNPALERALARAADLLRDDERALDALARALIGGGEAVSLQELAAAPAAVRRRVVRRLAARAGGEGARPEAAHVEAVLALAAGAAPGAAELPGGLEARTVAGRLAIGPRAARPRLPGIPPQRIAGPGAYRVDGLGLSVEIAGTPPPPGWPLDLRTRRPGDRFRPTGAPGGKKLKAWLIDRKIPRERRDRLLLLASGQVVLAIPELGVRAPAAAGLSIRLG